MSVPTLLHMMVKQTAKNQKMHRTDKAIYHFQNIDSFGQRNNQNQFYYIQSKTTNNKTSSFDTTSSMFEVSFDNENCKSVLQIISALKV